MQPRLGANDRPLSNPGERLQLALEAAERPATAGLLMLARSALGACYTSTSTTYGSRFARARSGSLTRITRPLVIFLTSRIIQTRRCPEEESAARRRFGGL